jgi:hypothetical protein
MKKERAGGARKKFVDVMKALETVKFLEERQYRF